jgi:hypothetical protein
MIGEHGNGCGYRWQLDFLRELRRMSRSGVPELKTAAELVDVSMVYLRRYRNVNREFDLAVTRIILDGRLVEEAERRREANRRMLEDDD